MPPLGITKQRTRQHVLAGLSANFLECRILEESHSAHRFTEDYGYDLALMTYDSRGYVEPGLVYFQLKASEVWRATRHGIPFDLDVRDHNLWLREAMPVVLVLYEATKRRAYWLHVQDYFRSASSRIPKPGAKTVRVIVPIRQRLNRPAVRRFRALKEQALGSRPPRVYHD